MGSRDDFRRIDLKIEKMGVSHLTSDLEKERGVIIERKTRLKLVRLGPLKVQH